MYPGEEAIHERTFLEDPGTIKRTEELIAEDPGCSVWKIATIVGVSGMKIGRTIKKTSKTILTR